MIWSPIGPDGYYPDSLKPCFAMSEFQPLADDDEPITEHYITVIERVRKSVLFIGTKEHGKFRPRATAFIVSIQLPDFPEIGWRYLVTADHVVSNLKAKGHDIWLRCNRKDGTAQEDNWSEAQWFFHPDVGSTDIAVAGIDFDPQEDITSLLLLGGKPVAATQDILEKYKVAAGDEVLIAGLFRSHSGQQRNIPIIRTGNIAAMVGEKVYTKHCNYTDAYLIEARSISGLSGSPVFIRPRVFRDGIWVGYRLFLLGLMHGHFDVPNLTEDVVVEPDSGEEGSINTGIGVVIPVDKILETICQPELHEMRKKGAKEHRERNGATSDVDDSSSPPAIDANPRHREDFNSLVDAAAKKPEPKAET